MVYSFLIHSLSGTVPPLIKSNEIELIYFISSETMFSINNFDTAECVVKTSVLVVNNTLPAESHLTTDSGTASF